MEIHESKSGNTTVLAFNGRLDANTSPAAQEKFLSVIDQGAVKLVIDLAKLDYISSAGLRIFMMGAKRVKPANGRIVLCAMKEETRELFEIAGFSELFTVFATRDEAVQSFD